MSIIQCIIVWKESSALDKCSMKDSTVILWKVIEARKTFKSQRNTSLFVKQHYRWVAVVRCSVRKGYPTLCDPMDCSTPVLHCLLEFAQIHVHESMMDTPRHPLSPPSPAFNLPQHQDLFHWVSSSQQVAKVLESQLQPHSFQWIPRVDFL